MFGLIIRTKSIFVKKLGRVRNSYDEKGNSMSYLVYVESKHLEGETKPVIDDILGLKLDILHVRSMPCMFGFKFGGSKLIL